MQVVGQFIEHERDNGAVSQGMHESQECKEEIGLRKAESEYGRNEIECRWWGSGIGHD